MGIDWIAVTSDGDLFLRIAGTVLRVINIHCPVARRADAETLDSAATGRRDGYRGEEVLHQWSACSNVPANTDVGRNTRPGKRVPSRRRTVIATKFRKCDDAHGGSPYLISWDSQEAYSTSAWPTIVKMNVTEQRLHVIRSVDSLREFTGLMI